MKNKNIPLILVLSLVGLIVLGGGTVYAADGAKPGDLLYPVDQLSENVQRAMTKNKSKKAELELKLYDERVAELDELDKENDASVEKEIEDEKDIKGLDVAVENFYEQYDRMTERMNELKTKLANGEITQEQYDKLSEKLNEISQDHQERITKMLQLQERIENKIQEKRQEQQNKKNGKGNNSQGNED